jgi:hypothetical protein
MTLDEIVDHYIETHRVPARLEMRKFRRLASLGDAIRHASLCHRLPSLKRHPHQYRIPSRALEAAERKLQHVRTRLCRAASFDALHDLVRREIGSIEGIAALTVYDIAHRIGAYLGQAPRRVYLHRGTRIGVRRLGFGGETLAPGVLPSATACSGTRN